MENFEQSETHRVLAKAYSTMPVGEPSVNIKISREAFRDKDSVAITKATYFPEMQEVVLETKLPFMDIPTTTFFKIGDMEDRVILEAIPNDVLKKLYMSIKLQMEHRGLPL